MWSANMWFQRVECIWLILLVSVFPWSSEQNQGPYNVYHPPQAPSPQYNHQYNQNPLIPGVGLGPRDYGDVCESRPSLLYPTDENKMCNIGRGLACNPYAQRCVCIVPDAIYRHGKCRAKVNRACIGSDGVTIDCVYNAVCNQVSQLCQCRPNLLPNAEETACNSAPRPNPPSSSTILFIISLATFAITYVFSHIL